MTTRNNINNKRKTNTSLKENNSMSKTDITIAVPLDEDTIALIAQAVADILGDGAEAKPSKSTKAALAKKAAASKPTRKKAEPEPEEDEDDEEEEEEFDQEARQAELAKMRITALRKMAIELGFPEDEVAEADKDTLAESIAEAEAEDAGVAGDDEDADDEEDEDEEEGEDEDEEQDYESMTIAELRAAAKEAGYGTGDLKGLKKNDIIDLLNSDEEDEEEEEDEEDEDGDDEEWYTEEDLEDLSLAELKAICKDYEIKVPRGAKQADLVDAIVNFEG